MKNTQIYFMLIGLFMLPVASANASTHKPPHPRNKPVPSSAHKSSASLVTDVWKPDPKLMDNLTDETQVSIYAMRLPEGYSEIPQPPEVTAQSQNGFESHIYSMRRRSDGTSATLAFVVATPPPGISGTLTLADALDGTLQQKKHQWQDFVESPVQDGHVGGMTFKRVYFKGTVSGAAGIRRAHGFAYVTIDGKSILSFQSEDVEPYNDETLSIAQAAVLTFHKQTNP